MPLTVEAVYENGVLKPTEPLPFKVHEKVTVTVHPTISLARQTAGMVRWTGTVQTLADFDRVAGLTRYAPV